MSNDRQIAGFLHIVQPVELAGKRAFFLGSNIVGRSDAKASIVIKESSISQKHASLYATATSLKVTDLGSKNGTKINQQDNFIQRDHEHTLDSTMIVYFADVKCKIEFNLPPKEEKKSQAADSKQSQPKKLQDIMRLFDDQSEAEELEPKQQISKKQPPHKATKDESKQKSEGGFDLESGLDTNKQSKKIKATHQQNKGKAKNKEEKLQGDKKQRRQKMEKKQNKQEFDNNTKTSVPEQKPIKPTAQVTMNKKMKKVDSKQVFENSKGFPSKKDKKVASPAKTEEESDLFIQRQRQSSPVVKKGKNARTKSIAPSSDVKARKSARLSNEQRSNYKDNNKLSVPNIVEKKVNRSKDEKINKSKGKQLNRTLSPRRNGEPEIKLIRPQVQDKSPKAESKQPKKEPQKRENHLFAIKQKENESGTTKKKGKRKMSSSLPRDTSSSYFQNRMIPPRQVKIPKKILFSSGCDYTLKRSIFKIVDSVDEPFDFLVMRQYSRTFKALMAILKGIPIVSVLWVQQCESFLKILKHQKYCFSNFERIYRSIQEVKNGNKVFDGLEICLISKGYHFSKQCIQSLITTGGGTVVSKMGRKKDRSIAIIRNEDHTKEYQAQLNNAKRQGFQQIYKIEMILDSCERQRIYWDKNRAEQ